MGESLDLFAETPINVLDQLSVLSVQKAAIEQFFDRLCELLGERLEVMPIRRECLQLCFFTEEGELDQRGQFSLLRKVNALLEYRLEPDSSIGAELVLEFVGLLVIGSRQRQNAEQPSQKHAFVFLIELITFVVFSQLDNVLAHVDVLRLKLRIDLLIQLRFTMEDGEDGVAVEVCDQEVFVDLLKLLFVLNFSLQLPE